MRKIIIGIIICALFLIIGFIFLHREEIKFDNIFDCAFLLTDQIKDVNEKGNALAVIASRYIEMKNYAKALEIAETKSIPIIKESILADMADQYAKDGDHAKAIEMIQKIEKPSSRAFYLQKLALGLEKAGEKTLANQTLSEALEVVKNIQKNNSFDFERIATGYAILGDTKKAVNLIALIKTKYPRDEIPTKRFAFFGMISECISAGKKEQALDLLSQVSAIFPNEKDAGFMTTVAGDYIALDEKARGLEFLSKAKQAVNIMGERDYFMKIVNLGTIAIAYINAGEYDEADQLAEKIQNIGDAFKVNTRGHGVVMTPKMQANDNLSKIAIQYAAKQQFERALKITEKITSFWKSSTQQGIVVQYIKAGQCAEAFALSAEIENPLYRVLSLIEVSKGFTAAGQKDKALEALSDATNFSRQINPDVDKEYLVKIVRQFLDLGETERAAALAKTLPSGGTEQMSRASMMTSFQYADSGQFEKALLIVKDIGDKRKHDIGLGQYDNILSEQVTALAGIGVSCEKNKKVLGKPEKVILTDILRAGKIFSAQANREKKREDVRRKKEEKIEEKEQLTEEESARAIKLYPQVDVLVKAIKKGITTEAGILRVFGKPFKKINHHTVELVFSSWDGITLVPTKTYQAPKWYQKNIGYQFVRYEGNGKTLGKILLVTINRFTGKVDNFECFDYGCQIVN